MGEADVRAAADLVVTALREARRTEATIRRYAGMMDRFAAFLADRGLDVVSDEACLDFIASQTGTRPGSLRARGQSHAVSAVRRPVVLLAGALSGRAVVIVRSVAEAADSCPARFRQLRDDYLASCRERGNAERTVSGRGDVASLFLAYLDEAGGCDLASLGVREVSGFLLRQRGLRPKTVALRRSCLGDFLAFLAGSGHTPLNLADRLPPHRHVRGSADPHLWTVEEIRRVLAVIDRQAAIGKRDYAMILMTARLGLRICDLRHLELADLDWRARIITIVQHKTGRLLRLPLLDDVGWAIIDYLRHGRPETGCTKVFVRHLYPFGPFGDSTSVGTRLRRYAARAGLEFPPGRTHGMHSLRGALAVAMIGTGTPVPVVSAVLGHASADTTQEFYLRFDTEQLRCCALDVEDVPGFTGGAAGEHSG